MSTIKELCKKYNISSSFFYMIKKENKTTVLETIKLCIYRKQHKTYKKRCTTKEINLTIEQKISSKRICSKCEKRNCDGCKYLFIDKLPDDIQFAKKGFIEPHRRKEFEDEI